MNRRALLVAATAALAAAPACAVNPPPIVTSWGRRYFSSGSPSEEVDVLGDPPASPRKTALLLYQDGLGTLTAVGTSGYVLGQALAAAGWTVCSVTTPCHNTPDHYGAMDGISAEPWQLPGWLHRYQNGRRLWDKGFFARCGSGLDRLTEAGYVDPTRIAVIGVSRGGLCAMHWAAQDARARWIVCLNPVTELLKLQPTFAAPLFPEACAAEDVKLLAPALTGRSIYWTVNAHDTTVSTQATIDAYQACVAAASPTDLIVPDQRLTIVEAPGHRTPDSEHASIVAWLNARAG